MKHKYCYDIMPKSAKIVVFDTQLLVSLILIFFFNGLILAIFVGIELINVSRALFF